jgi:hypothetical protein
MNDEQYHDLLGRIQSLTDIFAALVSVLDKAEVVDAESFAADLKRIALMRDLPPELLESAREHLNLAAEEIEGAVHAFRHSENEQ